MGSRMNDHRSRATGRRGAAGERFALIPASVLRSEAVRTLNHAYLRVLLILAVQYSGSNNGSLACTPRFAEQFGLRGRDTVYKALRELVARGLIVHTRQGIKQKDVFSLYALAWQPVHCRDGAKLLHPEPRDNERWTSWRRSSSPAPSSSPARGKNSDRGSVPMNTGRRDCGGPLGTDSIQ
jgi:hypothetical protein